ncbi:unnamed protein product [Lupinus luteus]|uniref:Uncharacterized protein n=1 Tax=Lupinus luteus TaxID=3873 RepID=A0AAV1WA22_LUPLU
MCKPDPSRPVTIQPGAILSQLKNIKKVKYWTQTQKDTFYSSPFFLTVSPSSPASVLRRVSVVSPSIPVASSLSPKPEKRKGQMNLLIPNLQQQQLSFSKTLSQCHFFFCNNKPSQTALISKPTIIRMGGGPRTFPGGVSKWQWKRMQAKKAKQLLKARLSRERQIYEMRKRAELKAAVSELERPWEVVEKSPNLFSIGADEQVKVLADRFQRPGGFDMWSDKDGPQLFETPDELPSARFFPKGVVHSIKPYRKVELDDDDDDDDDDEDGENGGNFAGEFSRIINERNFLKKGADDGERFSSPSNYGRNEVNVDGGSDDGERFYSPLNNGRNEESSDGRRTKSGYGRNEVNVDGRRSKNGNERRFLLKDVDDGSDDGERSYNPMSHEKSGMNADGRMRKNGNGRRFLSKGVKGSSGERSSPLNYEKNGMSGDGRARKNGNERRFMSEGVDDFHGEFSSPLNYESNGVNVEGRMRKNENGRRLTAKDVNDFDGEFSSPMNFGRNGNSRMRNNGDGRRFLSRDIDGPAGEFSSRMNHGRNGVNDRATPNENRRRFMSKNDNRFGGSDDGRSSSPLKHRRNEVSGHGRMRRDQNEKTFMSKDIGGSNRMNTGRVGSGRKQRGSNSIRGSNYSRGTSGYASRRSRDADSEVYDMGLQQDGSYGFQQNSYQSDSKTW